MAKVIKRDFLEGDKVALIMLALNATKIQSSPKIITFILAINQCIDEERELTLTKTLELFKIVFGEDVKKE
jgi:hypothetical protein